MKKIKQKKQSGVDRMRENQELHSVYHNWGYLITFRFKPSKLALNTKQVVVQGSIGEIEDRVRLAILGYVFDTVIISASSVHKSTPISFPIKLTREQWDSGTFGKTVEELVASLGNSLLNQQTAPLGKLIGKSVMFDLSQIGLAEEDEYDHDASWQDEVEKFGSIEQMMQYHASADPVFGLVYNNLSDPEIVLSELQAAHVRFCHTDAEPAEPEEPTDEEPTEE